MANLKYNFVNDNFLVYEASPEPPKVEIDLPVLNSPLDISDWAYRVTKNNIPIIKDDGFLSDRQREEQEIEENQQIDSENEFDEGTQEDSIQNDIWEESNSEELEPTEDPIIEDIPQIENKPQELPRVINAPTRVEVPGLNDVVVGERKNEKKDWDKATLREKQMAAMKYFSSVRTSLPGVKKVLKPYQAAAIVGNLMYESGGLNTRAFKEDENAIGLAQWRLDRLDGLKRFAKSKGTDMFDFNTQLEYVWYELNNNSKEKKALIALLKTKNIEEATKVFMETFERPDLRTSRYGGIKTRIEYAKSCLP